MNILLRYSLVLCFLATSTYAQKVWKEASIPSKKQGVLIESSYPSVAKVFSLNMNALKSQLADAPERGKYRGASNTIISIPNADGNMMRFRVAEASVFAPELQARYPEIRSYAGYGIDDPTAYLRFSISPYKGMSGIVLSGKKGGNLIIDASREDVTKVAIFRRADKGAKREKFECATVDDFTDRAEDISNELFAADDSILRTYDLAMSVTGEYTAYHGGTLAGANAAIAATMTRVNGIFEKDFNANMVIIAGNDAVIFLNSGSDPYGPTDANYNSELQTELDATIGSGNYDIGHLMSAIGNNGNAGCIGCVCVGGSKGSAFTTSTVPVGDSFDVDYVAHEMGHQFGGRHTFTHASEGAGVAQMEPGSGSTIMGYAGITGPTDVQPNSDPYFHAISIDQITTHVKSRTCDLETATGNNTPVVNAGADVTLPIGTPFKLTGGSATDADLGDVLTYCWEQYNEEDAANAYPDQTDANNNRPLFRSYNPTFSPERTFPFLTDLVANGVNGNAWERVPTVGRTADFRLTVRDNRAGGANNSFDDMVVTWDPTYGPFEVTSQNVIGLSYVEGETINVTWNVNNTTALPGSANVNILLSTDGGIIFNPIALNVPNDGSENITLPNSAHQQCRILIEPTANDYFAINTIDFAIGYDVVVANVCQDYPINANVSVPVDAGSYAGYTLTNIPSHLITDLNVRVDITNPDMADMYYAISPPSYGVSGIFVRLASAECSGFANIDKIYDDEGAAVDCANSTDGANTIPLEPLTAFDGENSGGNWIFWITDVTNPGNATWNSTTLTICYDEIQSMTLDTEEFAFDEFVLYPNPNKGSFNISLASSSGRDIAVFIHDMSGRRIYENSFINNATFKQEVKVPNAQSGIYFVSVTDGDRKEVRKIIIQ